MNQHLETYKDVVVQLATPYSTGTGFYLEEYQLVVTNEHVVRDNRQVVLSGRCLDHLLADVVFLDPLFDLAFLRVPPGYKCPQSVLARTAEAKEGDVIVAIGHPYGLKFTATQGIISGSFKGSGDIRYIQHDAALNPGNSGGPLINERGEIIGINTFIIRNGHNIGFSLPVEYLHDTIQAFLQTGGKEATRCASCTNLVSVLTAEGRFCHHCGSKVMLPSRIQPYEPSGVAATIEEVLTELKYQVALCRRGPNNWEINRGSATINISYHEKSGLITGDAYLGFLPKSNIKELYIYLLKANFDLDGMAFSIRGNDIILSLLIFDQYLNINSALHLFDFLFVKADEVDNILVEKFGVLWREEP